jgi:ABC-type multidrug transport system permease subunit
LIRRLSSGSASRRPPGILLSGFMFPFLGMPVWVQHVRECLPLTHYLRIVRAIMLKGSPPAQPGI